MADVLPLIPMTQRQLALLPPDQQRDYWNSVYRLWANNSYVAEQRDYQADRDDARHSDEWCAS
jgi:hypothetical protein